MGDRARAATSPEEVVRTLTMDPPAVVEVSITVAVDTREELTRNTIETMVTVAAITMVAEIIRVTEAVAIMIKGTAAEMDSNRTTVIVMKAIGVCEALAMGLLATATIVLLEGDPATPIPRAMANSNEAVVVRTISPLITTMRQVAMAATTVEDKATEAMVAVSTSPATTQIKETEKIIEKVIRSNLMLFTYFYTDKPQ